MRITIHGSRYGRIIHCDVVHIAIYCYISQLTKNVKNSWNTSYFSLKSLQGTLNQFWGKTWSKTSQQTDQKRRFVVYEHDRSRVFCYLWLEAEGYFPFSKFSILCLWLNCYCANKWWVSFTLSNAQTVPLLSTAAAIINTKRKFLRWALSLQHLHCKILLTASYHFLCS